MTHLSPHLACCSLEPHIFLDLRQDRFFQLPPQLDSAFRRWAGGVRDPQLEAELIDAGLIIKGPPPRSGFALHDPALDLPATSLIETATDETVRPAGLMPIAGMFAWTSALLGLGHLDLLLAAIARQRNKTLESDPVRPTRAFLAKRRLLPIRPVCLRDSLVLTWHLRRSGAAGELVIGVKHHPFAAHSWVQHEALILNDHLDNVRGFAPLIVA